MNENTFFREVTKRMAGNLSRDKYLQPTIGYLRNCMPVSSMTLAQYDIEKNISRVVAHIAPKHWPSPSKTLSLHTEVWRWLKQKENFLEGGVKLIENISTFTPAQIEQKLCYYLWPPHSSILFMPLKLDDQQVGFLFLVAEPPHKFTQEHAHLISLINDPVSMAMFNLVQHEEVTRLQEFVGGKNQYQHNDMVATTRDAIIGARGGLKQVIRMALQVATVNSPVLILGETGTGKEVIANLIHQNSDRRNKPFIKINCGAIPESLIDSELFGHEKGAFTNALTRKRGKIERAHGGTLFLDEIGELSLPGQVRLLRVLQNKVIERVGGHTPIPVDVRIIAATHRKLGAMVESGMFREDLWFRLNVFPLALPPLRDRPFDIPALVDYFIEVKSKELKLHLEYALKPGSFDILKTYHWPGNVRELGNVIERALIQASVDPGKSCLDFTNLLPGKGPDVIPVCKNESIKPLDMVIFSHIQKALEITGGKIEGRKGAASLLQINPSTLRGKMRKLGLARINKSN